MKPELLSKIFMITAYIKTREGSTPALNEFDESEYDGEWLRIGRFLRTMTPDAAWMREGACQVRRKAY
mgnify:CR=1 FL=1